MTFGSYCLWSIGMGLVRLKECPDAYNELLVVSFFFLLFVIPPIFTSVLEARVPLSRLSADLSHGVIEKLLIVLSFRKFVI